MPGESHGWRSLIGYSPWGRKESDTTERLFVYFIIYLPGLPRWLSGKESACNEGDEEMGVQSLGQEDPLEKEMATHSSILAWKIPWMEEHGRLQSMGSQRVGHD